MLVPGRGAEGVGREEDWGGELVVRAAEELRASSSEESASNRLSSLTLDLVPFV